MVVLFATVVSVLKGNQDTLIYKHKINKTTIYKAMTITASSIFLVFISLILIDFLEKGSHISELSIFFEVVSAFGTVGLSTGITGILSAPSKIILCLLMFIGRIGPISLVLALTLKRQKRIDNIYPEGKLLIG